MTRSPRTATDASVVSASRSHPSHATRTTSTSASGSEPANASSVSEEDHEAAEDADDDKNDDSGSEDEDAFFAPNGAPNARAERLAERSRRRLRDANARRVRRRREIVSRGTYPAPSLGGGPSASGDASYACTTHPYRSAISHSNAKPAGERAMSAPTTSTRHPDEGSSEAARPETRARRRAWIVPWVARSDARGRTPIAQRPGRRPMRGRRGRRRGRGCRFGLGRGGCFGRGRSPRRRFRRRSERRSLRSPPRRRTRRRVPRNDGTT